MSKHIKKFETEQAFAQWRQSEDCELPQLSWCVTEDTIKSEAAPHDYSQDYFTIVSTSDNNVIGWKASNASVAKTISVSTDDGQTWIDKTSTSGGTTLATLNTGDKLLIKGSNTAYGASSSNYKYFTSTGQFNVEGNIMSMIYGDNFSGQTVLSQPYTLKYLFYNAKVVDASNLVLPATTLENYCYQSMFRDCTSLTTAPAILPADALITYCYTLMFAGCTSLTTAPALPATTLANNCYLSMFNGCTSLTTAPTLPATKLADGCYYNMFKGCTSLTTAPTLPATTVYNCYNNMFSDCTSLTTAPALPATTLADCCYQEMFRGCTGLTTAPELPATKLEAYCYCQMFDGCTNLNYIKCLATSGLNTTSATTNWVANVAASGTFVKDLSMSGWTIGVDGIPNGWTVQDAS